MMILNILLQTALPEANFFAKLFEVAPVVAVMGFGLWWLSKELKEAKAEVKESNTYIRGMAEKSITTLKDVQNMMDKVFDNQVVGSQEIKEEIIQQNLELKKDLASQIRDLLLRTDQVQP